MDTSPDHLPPALPQLPEIVSRGEWQRARDALNAERRRLPMVRVEQEYVFDGPAAPPDWGNTPDASPTGAGPTGVKRS